LEGTIKLVLYRGYNAPTIFEKSTKEVVTAMSVALSKHVTNYGPWSGFSIYENYIEMWEGKANVGNYI
jgi:hypothetical protein